MKVSQNIKEILNKDQMNKESNHDKIYIHTLLRTGYLCTKKNVFWQHWVFLLFFVRYDTFTTKTLWYCTYCSNPCDLTNENIWTNCSEKECISKLCIVHHPHRSLVSSSPDSKIHFFPYYFFSLHAVYFFHPSIKKKKKSYVLFFLAA